MDYALITQGKWKYKTQKGFKFISFLSWVVIKWLIENLQELINNGFTKISTKLVFCVTQP